jgi:hypothetical protein
VKRVAGYFGPSAIAGADFLQQQKLGSRVGFTVCTYRLIVSSNRYVGSPIGCTHIIITFCEKIVQCRPKVTQPILCQIQNTALAVKNSSKIRVTKIENVQSHQSSKMAAMEIRRI